MDKVYAQGFMDKCAEVGIDPEVLLEKDAQLGAQVGKLFAKLSPHLLKAKGVAKGVGSKALRAGKGYKDLLTGSSRLRAEGLLDKARVSRFDREGRLLNSDWLKMPQKKLDSLSGLSRKGYANEAKAEKLLDKTTARTHAARLGTGFTGVMGVNALAAGRGNDQQLGTA